MEKVGTSAELYANRGVFIATPKIKSFYIYLVKKNKRKTTTNEKTTKKRDA